MMNDDEVRRISQFFFLLLLNERKALAFTSKAHQRANSILQKKILSSRDQAIVLATYEVSQKIQNLSEESFQTQFATWRLPESASLGPWKKFLLQQRREEILSLLWYRVLKVSDQDISEALKLSLGTIRFRLSRALKDLGRLSRENEVSHGL